ncbi:MAG: hypothetical protein KIS67_25950, partial [Verrucomicrobiae bacterium]|nr:hypothetical protein [Verrucomicrobiae bacterium]
MTVPILKEHEGDKLVVTPQANHRQTDAKVRMLKNASESKKLAVQMAMKPMPTAPEKEHSRPLQKSFGLPDSLARISFASLVAFIVCPHEQDAPATLRSPHL